jgi:hypothetical protein
VSISPAVILKEEKQGGKAKKTGRVLIFQIPE